MSSFTIKTVESWIPLPNELLGCFPEWDDKLKQLQKQHPWLQKLDEELPDLSELRHEFYTDGYIFMSVLDKFLNVRKWQEFMLSTCTAYSKTDRDGRYSPVLLALLQSAQNSPRFFPKNYELPQEEILKVLERQEVTTEKHASFINAIKARCTQPITYGSGGAFIETSSDFILQLAETEGMDHDDVVELLRQLKRQICDVYEIHGEAMTFGYEITDMKREPSMLLKSHHWKRIGRNLCTLGLHVGANVPRWPTEPKPVTLMTALKNVINNEGPAVKIMLSNMEEKQALIQKQQQVITALQFRHLLEHLPRPLRGKEVAAEKWDKMKEVDRWIEFWEGAVRQVYRWLASETNIGKHMKDLYSTLSQTIHQFSDVEFTVDSLKLNFSPGDARLLEALIPESSGEEDVAESTGDEDRKWKREFRRYIWSGLKTGVTEVTEVEAESSDEAALARVERFWESLCSDPPFPGVLTDRPHLATFNPDGTAKTAAQYKPDKSHLSCNGLLHSALVAALVDSVGRMALAASGWRVTDGRTDLKFSNLLAFPADDEIQVSATASEAGKNKGHWQAVVEIKGHDGCEIAKGQFEAWGS
ncbi:hypothetical protein Neosp_009749 [[Neocosmospora] mangrovei]